MSIDPAPWGPCGEELRRRCDRPAGDAWALVGDPGAPRRVVPRHRRGHRRRRQPGHHHALRPPDARRDRHLRPDPAPVPVPAHRARRRRAPQLDRRLRPGPGTCLVSYACDADPATMALIIGGATGSALEHLQRPPGRTEPWAARSSSSPPTSSATTRSVQRRAGSPARPWSTASPRRHPLRARGPPVGRVHAVAVHHAHRSVPDHPRRVDERRPAARRRAVGRRRAPRRRLPHRADRQGPLRALHGSVRAVHRERHGHRHPSARRRAPRLRAPRVRHPRRAGPPPLRPVAAAEHPEAIGGFYAVSTTPSRSTPQGVATPARPRST